MQKKILTQEDFDNNPELTAEGRKVGDEIEIPDTENETTDEQALTDDDETGGTQPPPGKKRP